MNICAKLALSTVTLSSILTMASQAYAITLRITLENLSPTNGQGIAPVWVGFHDGTFDIFNEGSAASSDLEQLAEDGFFGNTNNRIPADFFVDAMANGLNPAVLGPNSVTTTFAASAAGANGGYQDLLFFDRRVNPLFATSISGESTSIDITLDNNFAQHQYFSYAGMVFPSNDAFIGNDNAIQIFDAQGNFIPQDLTILGSDVWDAGTEVNDESPINVPYDLNNLRLGTAENGVVRRHSGLLPAGGGGILDFTSNGFSFENANFAAPNYRLARITIQAVPESTSILGLCAFSLLGIASVRAKARSKP